MAGTDLRQGTGLQAGKIVTVDNAGGVGTGEAGQVKGLSPGEPKIVDLSGKDRTEFNLVRKVVTNQNDEGLFEYMAFGFSVAANETKKIIISDQLTGRGSLHVEGSIVGGVGDGTRIAAGSFILNKYTTGAASSDAYYTLGEAFNGFIHPDPNSSYPNILATVDLYRVTNADLGFKLTNNSSYSLQGATVHLRILKTGAV